MALIIDPPANAVPVYPWMIAQDYYLGVLETVRASQAAIDVTYDFDIQKNRISPYISGVDKTQLVNCMIGARTDSNETINGRDVELVYSFEIIAKSSDEGSNKAGEILIERSQYLASMVEFALTALYNNVNNVVPALPVGSLAQGGISVSFIDPQEIRKSESLLMFGSVNLAVKFSLSYADYAALPILQTISTAIDNNVYDFPANTE